jgi:tRNA threonylcarbamoyladenosine dehydratase
LRQRHGFTRGDRRFGIECVVSTEQVVYPKADGSVCAKRVRAADLRLDCNSGFGTASFVTGTFGLVAASRVVHRLVQEPKLQPAEAPRKTDVNITDIPQPEPA